MIRMYMLEQRFDHTGRKGVEPLSDIELKELYNLYYEASEYFRKTENNIIEQWFLLKNMNIRSCLHARGFYEY